MLQHVGLWRDETDVMLPVGSDEFTLITMQIYLGIHNILYLYLTELKLLKGVILIWKVLKYNHNIIRGYMH